jgi:bifunctional non-homologous end joining protein LigD
LWSRNRNSFLGRFPEVGAALRSLRLDGLTLDGELVAHDGRDFVGFSQLQQHGSSLQVVYCAFDLLAVSGRDTRVLGLADRKRLLRENLRDGASLHLVPELPGAPVALLDAACRQGWEGLVGKRVDAPYTGGRSRDWVKLKCSASQEFVVGGWTEPRGARAYLGALLVGYYEDGRLRYAGKVGTGFTNATLATLARELAPLEQTGSPFADQVRERDAHWVEPRLVGNIGFTEWTRDGRLRHPRFQGLRRDKPAAEVVRERPVPGAS